ncbi:endonuclease [Nocardioides anomalus]|uniref:Endonuclease n=1 Tax=Nocardioides anomalus TaxID=2712223 RepID=A0A6G6WA82_9ACTN|nr:endonuclease [Nocardioides anomalus]QIG42126.1 endonuclease [Nocardioides anomalus]
MTCGVPAGVATHQDIADRVLREHGTTYAEDAGITLRDEPAPLYQLLVLTTLASTRISADLAVAAARELFYAGWRTPERLLASTWRQRVDALGRAHYKRYDESTATKLEESARHLEETYRGDLRALRPSSPDGADELADAIADFPRIGPVGARIFVREVQDVWGLAPFLDEKALAAAGELGLPTDPRRLAELAPRGQVARLAAAVVKAV